MKGYYVIKSQKEADRLTKDKGVQRFVGECMYYGTRNDKPKLKASRSYYFVPSDIPQLRDTDVWDFDEEKWRAGTEIVERNHAIENRMTPQRAFTELAEQGADASGEAKDMLRNVIAALDS